MRNRDRILDVALLLFNEQGTAAVSTNHIAEAAGISPGNLYYHYSNKGHIIRALFERLFAAWDAAFQLPTDRPPTMADLDALIAANFALVWEFRFAYREQAALLRVDAELQRRYGEVRRRGYAGFSALIDAFAAAGVLVRRPDAREEAILTDLCWLVSEQWPVHLELSGRAADAEGFSAGVAAMRSLFQPFLKPDEPTG